MKPAGGAGQEHGRTWRAASERAKRASKRPSKAAVLLQTAVLQTGAAWEMLKANWRGNWRCQATERLQ